MRPDSSYHQALKEFYHQLHAIFGFQPKEFPDVYIVPNKASLESLINRACADWEIGFAKDNAIYFLTLDAIRATASHKNYSTDDVVMAIKHEAAHLYFNQLIKRIDEQKMPRWLSEGLATYWSGQYAKQKQVKKFEHLNDASPDAMKYHYGEGGAAVQILVDIFGIEKLNHLFYRLEQEKNASNFSALFADVYGFLPTDEEFNCYVRPADIQSRKDKDTIL